MKPALTIAAALVALCACSASVADDRQAIAEQRRRLETGFAAEEAACARRFAVNACLEDVRLRRRAELTLLREQELRLDDEARQARAEERRASVAAKQAAAAARPASGSTPPAEHGAPPAQDRAPPLPSSPSPRDPLTREAAAAQAARAATAAAERARAAERRREEARLAQERIARRLAERAAQGRPVAPLPGASASPIAP